MSKTTQYELTATWSSPSPPAFHIEDGRVASGWFPRPPRAPGFGPPPMAAPQSLHVRGIALSDDGRHARLWSHCYSVWNLVDGTCSLIDLHSDRPWDRRERRMIECDGRTVAAAHGAVVRVSELESMREVMVVDPGGPIRDIAIRGDRLAVAVDGRASVWRMPTGERLASVEADGGDSSDGYDTRVHLTAERLVVTRKLTCVFRIGETSPERSMSGYSLHDGCFTADASSVLAFSPAPGPTSHVAELLPVPVNVNEGKITEVKRTLTADTAIGCAALSANGATAVFGHAGSVTVWDVERAQQLQRLDVACDAVAITTDAATIVVAAQGDVHVWRAR